MRTSFQQLSLWTFLLLLSASCSNAQGDGSKTVIAQKDGYTLRYEHFQAHLASYYRMGVEQMDADAEKQVLIQLITDFNVDPANTMKTTEEELELFKLYGDQRPKKMENVGAEEYFSNTQPNPAGYTPNNNGGVGFQAFRQAAAQVGVQPSSFDQPVANAVRNHMKNTVISYEKAETYSGGAVSYKEVIQFCGDGTVLYQNNSGASGATTGLSGGQSGFRGVWEVIDQQGIPVIMMYSREPYALQFNPQGFIPLMVKNYNQDMVRIANQPQDVLYRREINYCR